VSGKKWLEKKNNWSWKLHYKSLNAQKIYHKRQKFCIIYAWRISLLSKLANEILANLLYQLIVNNIIAYWWIKVWWIFLILQIRQTKATLNFCCYGSWESFVSQVNWGTIFLVTCNVLKALTYNQLQFPNQTNNIIVWISCSFEHCILKDKRKNHQ